MHTLNPVWLIKAGIPKLKTLTPKCFDVFFNLLFCVIKFTFFLHYLNKLIKQYTIKTQSENPVIIVKACNIKETPKKEPPKNKPVIIPKNTDK